MSTNLHVFVHASLGTVCINAELVREFHLKTPTSTLITFDDTHKIVVEASFKQVFDALSSDN